MFWLSCWRPFLFTSIFPTHVVIFHMVSPWLWFFPNPNWQVVKRILEAMNLQDYKQRHLTLSPKTKDLLKPPQTPKVVPCTPNLKPPKCPHSHEKPTKYPKCLLPPLTDAFMIEHILPKLPMDSSMMWCLCWVNNVWHKIVGESFEWHALNILKHHNVFYCHTIAPQELLKCSLKQPL